MTALPGAAHARSGPRVRVRDGLAVTDRVALAALGAAFVALAAVTWRKWGIPEVDAGAELTVADQVAHGAMPYQDVRYFYGPLGLGALAGTFRVFGTSLTVAFAFGLVQAAAILGCFYALSRRWLAPVAAGTATLVLLAIAFSGTAYNFVLPHTNSATSGLLCLLVLLLALAHRRAWAAGVALGLCALTRPEFLAVGLAVAVAGVAGRWRDEGRGPALGLALRLVVPAGVLGGGTLAAFAAIAGPHRLFLDNLWPVDFIRAAGFESQSYWMPFTAGSAIALVVRGLVYVALAGAVVVAADRAARATGAGARLRAAIASIGLGVLLVAAVLGAWRVSGVAAGERSQVWSEVTKGLIGMSWLPLAGLGAGAWAGWRFVRRRGAPLSGSWAVDLPLLVAAAALGLRAYDAFTDERSYAPYYAAPLVLLAAIGHHRLVPQRRAALLASRAALAGVACALAAYAVLGLYADDARTVDTPRGSYVADSGTAAGTQAALGAIADASRPGDPIVVAPAEGGLYFLSDRRPALYHVQLLPGLLESARDERQAIGTLSRQRVPVVVLGSRDLGAFGADRFGTDYNRRLGAFLEGRAAGVAVVGAAAPATGSHAAGSYTVLRLRW